MVWWGIPHVQGQSSYGYIDSLKNRLATTLDSEQRVEVLVSLANRYQTKSLDSALFYAKTALALANQENCRDSVFVQIHNVLGRTYVSMGVFDEATSHYLEGLKLAENNQQTVLYIKLLINMGVMDLRQGNYAKAEEKYLRVIELIKKYSEVHSFPKKSLYLASVYNNIALIYEHRHDTAMIMNYYDTALMYSTAIDDHRNISLILNNIGNIQLHQRNFEEAHEHIVTAIEIRKKSDNRLGLAQCYHTMGFYFLEQSQWDSSLYYFERSITLLDELGSLTDMVTSQKGLALAYEKMGKYKEALFVQKHYKQLYDSLFNIQRVSEIADIEAWYEFENRQAVYELEEKKRSFRFYLILSIIFCTTLVAGVWIIFHLKLQKRALESKHQNLNLTLEHKNKEMTTKALYQFQKNELIEGVVLQLRELIDKVDADQKAKVQGVIKNLGESAKDDTWAEFELHFNQTHQNFYKALEHDYPELTPNERRLCAFLKLQMTSKEISSLTGQSVRSIDVARTRLRKKFNLTNTEINLVDFLSAI
ncbi:hypothetical protein BFP72_07705 [Reichenbachiella sp. 5M10]|nr:hypothetical protein BFP72_07705 [Reichenbachiella sp. 5M10]